MDRKEFNELKWANKGEFDRGWELKKKETNACCVFNCADMGRDRKTTEIKGEKLPENLLQECFYKLSKKRELGSCSMNINKTNPSLFWTNQEIF